MSPVANVEVVPPTREAVPMPVEGVVVEASGMANPAVAGTLLREARAREEDARLEALLVEGLTSGEEIPLTKEFWKELKSEAGGIARKHRARKKL